MLTDFPLGTLILPEPARSEAWHRWRTTLDVDAMSYECLQTLPAVASRLPLWIEGDADAARFRGIVKRSWSRNQVRLHKAVEVRDVLLGASIETVALIGPLAWSLLPREEGAIRTSPDIAVMIPREHVFRAVSKLARKGWELRSPDPEDDTLQWSCNLALTKGDETLHLHWSLFPAAAQDASTFEHALLSKGRTVAWKGHRFQVLSAEAELLHRLSDRPPWDPVPWQADVLMASFAGIDWLRFLDLSDRFATFFEPVDVLKRLMDLRHEWQLPIAEMKPSSRRVSRALPLISDRMSAGKVRSKLGGWRSLLWRA